VLLPGLAAAAITPEMQQKIESLSRESDGIARQRLRWEGVQDSLLKQKAEIEAKQNEIAEAQDALNARGAQHNQQVNAQQQRLQKGGCGKQDDDSGVSGGDLATAQCDKDAKRLNAGSAGLNAQVADIQAQQDALSAKYAKANQDASDWNAHESQVTEQLNKVYRSMNDWLDRAYPVISDDGFRDEVAARGADAACTNRGLPADMSIVTAKRLNDSYRKCLKTMLQAEREAAKGAPVAAQP
jgi:septal ring factor EnvC (AmiA/AmiB activator)